MKLPTKQLGFSFIEIILSMGVFAILAGFITLNVLTSKHKISLASSIIEVISSTKQQQVRAMTLTTELGMTSDYGVYFTGNTYTLFRGSTYVAGNNSNFAISLGDNITFSSVSLPSSSVVFLRASGEVSSYDPLQHSISVKNTQTNEQKTIQINRYGVITSVN